ncbi:MAG: hypothetical protein ABJD13_08320 [Paracoccaceae bacterium]
MTLKCKFGKPQHGWLPVELLLDDEVLELNVSDVPVNPINCLILGLDRTINGLHDEIFFHLEPDGYYLCFQCLAEHSFDFRLERFETDTVQQEKRTLIYESTGNKHEIILPFWRAIKDFSSHSYAEPAWPAVDNGALSKLTKSVKAT